MVTSFYQTSDRWKTYDKGTNKITNPHPTVSYYNLEIPGYRTESIQQLDLVHHVACKVFRSGFAPSSSSEMFSRSNTFLYYTLCGFYYGVGEI